MTATDHPMNLCQFGVRSGWRSRALGAIGELGVGGREECGWCVGIEADGVDVLTAMLKRDHRAPARALFAQMPRREFDCFECRLAGVIARLRAHLTSNSGRSRARASTP